MSAGRWVVLEPLDTVSVRDGRAFDAGQQSVAQAAVPSPTTVAGAIGAAYGAPPGAGRNRAARGVSVPARVRCPFVVRRARGGGWRAWFPMPRDVVASPTGDARRVTVDENAFAGVAHDLDHSVATLPAVDASDSAVVDGWCDGRVLGRYLTDGAVAGRGEAMWQVERRVGLARGDDRTATDGMLYSMEHLRFGDGVGFAALCLEGPDVALARTVRFGGRGRAAEVHPDADVSGLPAQPADFPGGRMLLYLATAGVFPGGSWHPDLSAWPGARLVSAAVGPPQIITTATPRRDGSVGDGQLMWAAPAGSVYHLRFPDEQAAADAAVTIRDAPLAQAVDWMNTAGFGLAFTGRW